MCVWVKLSDFGIKYSKLLNTHYVKELVDNNHLYVIRREDHYNIMHENSFQYVHLRIFDISRYGNCVIGRVRSIDANNHMIEIDFDSKFEEYVKSLNEPRVSFLAYTTLNKTGPVFYIHDINDNTKREEDIAV